MVRSFFGGDNFFFSHFGSNQCGVRPFPFKDDVRICQPHRGVLVDPVGESSDGEGKKRGSGMLGMSSAVWRGAVLSRTLKGSHSNVFVVFSLSFIDSMVFGGAVFFIDFERIVRRVRTMTLNCSQSACLAVSSWILAGALFSRSCSGIDTTKNKAREQSRGLVGSSTNAFKKVGLVALCWTASRVGVRSAWCARGGDLIRTL